MKRNPQEQLTRGSEHASSDETKKKLLSYFISSFRYSQGNDTLQALFHTWAVHNVHLTLQELQYFGSLSYQEVAEKIMLPTNHVSVNMYEQLLKQQRILASTKLETRYDEEQILFRILQYLLEKDKVYFTRKRPTAKKPRQLKDATDTIHDPYSSYIRKYVLNPDRIRDPIFRALFSKLSQIVLPMVNISDAYLADTQEGRLAKRLLEIKRLWEKLHPGKVF